MYQDGSSLELSTMETFAASNWVLMHVVLLEIKRLYLGKKREAIRLDVSAGFTVRSTVQKHL